MTFKQLFTSLQIPLAKTSSVFVGMFTAFATEFDTMRYFVNHTIDQFFISNCDDVTLYAKERGIYKTENEPTESFRNRVVNAFTFAHNSSTKYGLENILKNISPKELYIRELFAESFTLGFGKIGVNTYLHTNCEYTDFIVDSPSPLTTSEYTHITEILNIYKPAHIGFTINAVIDDNA